MDFEMAFQIDLNQILGEHKILKDKKISLIKHQIHPDFTGIYNCYTELFKGLNFNLELSFDSNLYLAVCKAPQYDSYVCVHHLTRFYYFSQSDRFIHFHVYQYPENAEDIDALKVYVGNEFLNDLRKYPYQLTKLNPKRLQALINEYIPSECLLKLNKQYSYKAHKTMGLEVLAKELKVSDQQLQRQIKSIEKRRKQTLDDLEKNSAIAKAMLNDPNFVLTPDLIWTSS